MRVQNTEVFIIGFWLLPVGVVMCDRAVRAVEGAMRSHFGPVCSFLLPRKANMMSDSANIVLGL